ncbi:fibronectin type III domain-containing protein [Cryobacterium tagatosivorans]|uniref:Fibronectin type III domain-containing protein n=1 Tax=Cryobacterium tagatosivorans TaxID=1259199 RepID=A0A4R8UIM8_9MICO|nr:fibronectin type III domain-containing protein [Cryobacterium tagatosivorans]TFB53945.1 fibronectin type III domain-containing protein [Cryobacterium tagatosivorans]
MRTTLRRVAAKSIGLVVAVSLMVTIGLVATPAQPAEAANGADFNPGMIISDAIFYNGRTMTAAQVQTFLNGKVPSCWSGYTCLKSYRESTKSQSAKSEGCAAYTGQASETAAAIIYKVGMACGINPKALLVLLEKEQGLVTGTHPTASIYRKATGFGCPDTSVCDSLYYGFFNQVYQAAYMFKKYQARPASRGYVAGRYNTILWNPNSACGSSSVYIQNQATAGLYIYTPYRPNAAALANMYGTGNSCSAYGNRNFWRLFTDWFGSTSSSAATVASYLVTIGTPTGGNESATVRWSPPASTLSTITGYTVRALTSSGSVLARTQAVAGNVTSAVMTGLTNETPYSFDVAVVTATDPGSTVTRSSRSITVTPSAKTVAAAPEIGTAGAAAASAALAWTAPAIATDGAPITGYRVRALIEGGAVVARTQAVTGNVETVVVTGLANGTPYSFDVAAVNEIGTGAVSKRSATVTPLAVPDAPAIGTATAGDAFATVRWAPPASNGGSAITGYRVRALTAPGQVALTQNVAGDATSVVLGLTNGTAYSFDVAAVNALGTGPGSALSATVTPVAPTPPGEPGIGKMTAGDASATVRWTAPAFDGNSDITGYRVRAFTSTGVVALTRDVAGAVGSAVVTGLANGKAYSFDVAAVNAIGTGARSARSAVVTPVAPTAPGAATIGKPTAGNASATVRWSIPTSNGGSAITGYRVRALTGGGAAVALTQTVTGNVASVVVTGLANGTAYSFDVAAVNAVGVGTRSARSASVTPVLPPKPGAPTIGKPTGGNASATVRWTAPAPNGGPAITGYKVRALTGGGAVVALTQTVTGNVASVVVTGLTNETAYSFDVVAVNSSGAGARSARSASVTPSAATAPGAPTIGQPTAGKASVTVRWMAPVSDGGKAITGYRVRALTGGGAVVALTQAVTGNVSSVVVTGLKNGTAYSFDVVAVNAMGVGMRSTRSATVTPATIPSAPIIGTPTAASTSATVRWAIPASNGGSVITGYRVRALTGGGAVVALTQAVTGNVSSVVVTGLTNGTPYSFDVVAVNSAGAGARSARSATVTPR